MEGGGLAVVRLLSRAAWSVAATVAVIVFSLFTFSLSAATCTWNGGEGDWDTAANWDGEAVPSLTDDVVVPSGKVYVKSALAAKTLSIASGATVYFASTGTVSDAFIAYPDEPKTRTFRVAGDCAVAGTLVLGGGWRPKEYKMSEWIDDTRLSLAIDGDFSLSGSARVHVYASPVPTNAAYRVANGGSLVDFNVVYSNRTVFAIGGDFTVGDSAILYPVNDGVTGAPVEFDAASFTLGASAKICADDRGWGWFEYSPTLNDYDKRKIQARASFNVKHKTSKDRSFFTLAPSGSTPTGYSKWACYGCASADGKTPYGSAYAPFLPGVPGDIYQQITRAGGTVFIVTSGDMTINGTVTATAATGNTTTTWATPTGGGIWLCARRFTAGSGALLDAHGAAGFNFQAGTSSGGRISLGIGLSSSEIEALATGDETRLASVQKTDALDAISYNVAGGKMSATSYGPDGSVSTTYGSLGDCAFTVCGNPLDMTGVDPANGSYNYTRGGTKTFTAPEYGFDPGDPTGIRYRCSGWVLSNATERVDFGDGCSAVCSLNESSLRLTWQWTEKQYAAVVTIPDHAKIRVGGVDSSAATNVWSVAGETVSLEVRPDAGYEFLFWEGELPYGKARQNPLVLTADKARRLKPVVRPVTATATATWIGGTGELPDGSKVEIGEEEDFLAKYPDVTITLTASATAPAACKGTFRFLAGPMRGFVIIAR